MAWDFKSPSQPLSDINVTPLVDVMLVLLVIFMVTAPMFSQGLSVNLPEATAPPLVHSQALVVSIAPDRTLYLGERQMDLTGLGREVAAHLKERQNPEVLLKSDRDVPYGLVVQVMSTLKEAGVERLGVITAPAAP